MGKQSGLSITTPLLHVRGDFPVRPVRPPFHRAPRLSSATRPTPSLALAGGGPVITPVPPAAPRVLPPLPFVFNNSVWESEARPKLRCPSQDGTLSLTAVSVVIGPCD